MKTEFLLIGVGLWLWTVLANQMWKLLDDSPRLKSWAWRKLEANWMTVTLVMPLAMPLIAVAWADYRIASLVLWGAYAIGIPISAGVVCLVLRAKRRDIAIAAALVAYCTAIALTRHAGAWETLLPAVAALTTAAIVSTLYRAT